MRASTALWIAVLTLTIGVKPLSAQDKPDECPGTFEEADKPHPACPPAESLAWIDCPTQFPPDPSKKIRYGTPYFEHLSTMPDIERHMLDRRPEGGQLYCKYGEGDIDKHLYRLILEVPGPLVQWGWHKTPQGDGVGFRVPKELAAAPAVMQVVPPIDRNLALDGFRLGMSETEIRNRAAAAGYHVAAAERQLALRKAESRIDILLHPKTGKAREIIQFLDDLPRLERRRDFAYRYGLGWHMWDLKPKDPKYFNWTKKVWSSPDDSMAVEWHPKTPFGDPETLRLVDQR